jgi:membrane-associated phospholipid phosphatase
LLTKSSCGLLLLGAMLVPISIAHGQEILPAETSTSAAGAAVPASDADASSGNAVSVPDARSWTSQLIRDFAGDQVAIWGSPKDLRLSDSIWLFPVAAFTTGLFLTDTDVARHGVSTNPKTLSHYNSLSNYAVFGLVGGAGAMWLLSHANHNAHSSETGFLAGEAAVDSLAVTEALKYSLRRERPFVDNGNGNFFRSGGDSFPSEHSAAAWSVASLVAHEYPGPLTKILAYGAATLVSYSRVKAHQHFPSDVMVGALIGELAAYKVYSRHHDPELGGDVWEGWGAHARRLLEEPTRGNMGSPYVPLDSWVYPAIERLMGLGLIDSGFLAHRPWTRAECARMVAEAGERAEESKPNAKEIYEALETEFQSELAPPEGGLNVKLESIYTRVTQISDPPLGRGGEAFDFAQTLINDYGRPYEQGTNAIAGFSFYTMAGPWVGYVRGEYQYAPSAPALTLSERTFIAEQGGYPQEGPLPATPFGTTSQFQLIEAYSGLQFSNWLISFGPQSMWGGPAEGGSMLLSNNAQPIPMFRIARVSPLRIPLVSRFLGPAWFEVFLGQLSGHYFMNVPGGTLGSYASPLANQPYIHGERFSFKPTQNFEFGFTRTVVFGGGDLPLNLGYLKTSLFGLFGNGVPGSPQDAGKQASGMDWNYRLPLLRNWVSFYGDAFAWDQFSPIAYWDRSAISSGLYFSHLPRLSKLDFRIEGVYTDIPAGGAIGHGFWYSSDAYLNGYTNAGNLIGSWIGRDGQGAQAWTNWWFTPKNRLQFYFRHEKVSQQFVPGGGTLTDVGTRADYRFHQGVGITASVQYEKWLFPLIQPGPQTNVTTSIGVQFQPQKILKPALHTITSTPGDPGGVH